MKNYLFVAGILLSIPMLFFSCSNEEHASSDVMESHVSTIVKLANEAGEKKMVVQDAAKESRVNALGTTTISVVFPGGGTKGEMQAVEAVQTPKDLILLYDRTAADFYYPEAEVKGDTTITFSDKDAIEALAPLVAESRNILHGYGFTDAEIQEMLDENEVDETQLVMLMMAIANNEIECSMPESLQMMAMKQDSHFHIINDALTFFEMGLSSAFALPLCAQQMRTNTNGGMVSANTNQEFQIIVGCAVKALLDDITYMSAASGLKTYSKALIKKAFKVIAKKVLGPVGVVIAAADFGWCLYENGIF